SPLPLLTSPPFFFHSHPPPPDLHSFPTRRSSDLPGATDDPASPPLPGGASSPALRASAARTRAARFPNGPAGSAARLCRAAAARSEEHTSELQSRFDLVCRLLLEKKKK